MFKFAATGLIAFLIGLLAWSGTAAAAAADETTMGGTSSEAFLSRPGDVVEVEGRASRAIAFFEPGERDYRLTVILTGPALEGEPLRLTLGLVTGQDHAVTLGGEEGASERYSFSRSRHGIAIAFRAAPVQVGAQPLPRPETVLVADLDALDD